MPLENAFSIKGISSHFQKLKLSLKLLVKELPFFQVAFFASLEGEGSRGEGDYGIFATGHDGDLRLVARVGDSFEVSPGDERTITALSYAGIFGAHVLSFNEESNLSFLIKFDDGSQGIFTARVLPEPAALLLPAFTALALGRRRRRA